ncbi:WXG100 family type VII secretion target [Actinomadura napierensis]
MYQLAGQLYALAKAGNPAVARITKQVNDLIGQDHDKWSGQAADAFKNSYGQDAAIMTAVNRIASAVGGVMDNLACRLAEIEHGIDQQLEIGFAAGYFVQDDAFRRTNYPSPPPGPSQYTEMAKAFNDYLAKAYKDADEARKLAATELATLAGTLEEGLKYYEGKSPLSGSLDPGGLLNQGEHNWYNPKIEKVSKAYDEQMKKLKSSGTDLKSAISDMQKIGDGAQQVGDVISQIKPIEKYGTTISEIGSIISQIGGFAKVPAS